MHCVTVVKNNNVIVKLRIIKLNATEPCFPILLYFISTSILYIKTLYPNNVAKAINLTLISHYIGHSLSR